MKENSSNSLESGVTLKKVLSMPYLIMFGLAYLAPTVVFNYYGIITEMTRGMMALGYAITTVVMFFTAYSYAKMVEAFPVAGSAYTYVQKSVNPYLGFLTGWIMMLDYLLLPMICYLLMGIYINSYFPALPIWVIVVSVTVLGAAINIIGVKAAGIVDTVIIAAQMGFTFLLMIVIAKFVTGGGGAGTLVVPEAIYNPANFSMGAILGASAILCVSFLGFDAISTLAEETINPEKTISRAVIYVCVGAGILFFVVSYFTQIAWPTAFMEIEDVDSGIFELLRNINADYMADIFFVTDNLASFICAMAGLAAVSRVLYGMGRDGALPKAFFGKLNRKFQTPVNNIVLTSLIALTALFYQDNLFGAASLISFGAVSGFIMVNLSVIMHYYVKQKRRQGIDLLKYLLMPGTGIIICAVLWISLETNAKILGFGWLAIGIVYLALTTNFFRKLPPDMKLDD